MLRKDFLMKYLKQFLIILSVCCVGELIKYFVPLPIPASIYGLVLMLILLLTKVIRLEQVKDAADFLIEIMPVMFIPSTVGLIASWDVLQPVLVPFCIITIITTFVVMITTGKITDTLVKRKEKKDE